MLSGCPYDINGIAHLYHFHHHIMANIYLMKSEQLFPSLFLEFNNSNAFHDL